MASPFAIRLYHQAPPPVRSLIASARGLQLRWWRYGPETESLVSAALDRDTWPAARWRPYQQERLARILHDAARDVPYYREQWRARRARGDRSSPERLENWPVLSKDAVRRHGRALVSDAAAGRRLFADHTSGTTGKSLTLWCPKETVREWYALFEARTRRWYGRSRHDAWAILGGQLVTPQATRKPPFWVWNAPLRQLYMSSYHLAPDLVPRYLEALAKHNITYLYGYSSSLYALAIGARDLGANRLGLRVAITNAEPLFDYQRRVISEVFGCPVRETYGMAEIVTAGTQCENGCMHLWPDAGYVEILDGDAPVRVGTTGDLVCTGLLNPVMPLVRYSVGDRAALAADQRCGCRRKLPIASSIEGRADDVLYTIDGRPIGRLDPIFKEDLPVHEAQIIQEAPDRIRIRYVPAPGFSPAAMTSMAERLRDRLGAVQVIGEAVDSIPRTATGKFRAVVRAFAIEDLRSGSVH